MAYRLRFSTRALRETGEAQEWYELHSPGLGEEFIAAMELQLKRLEQAPLLYSEIIPSVRRALLPRFPYGLFYAVRGDAKPAIEQDAPKARLFIPRQATVQVPTTHTPHR